MRKERRRSGHPTDRLIRELIQTGRPAQQGEINLILERMATAPFDPRLVRVLTDELGLSYQNRIVQPHEEALYVHLVRRVLADEQWAFGVTQDQYLADLRRSIRIASARLALYQRRGGYIAATLTSTIHAVSAINRGLRSLPQLWVVFSADRGIIVTGYQVSAPGAVSIPKDTRWLQ
ncbi:MAG: hypothetical protein H0V00_08855 [Chloroflexia bacterium]|nr:hypothetical protein [Chloroflexia bacterium]